MDRKNYRKQQENTRTNLLIYLEYQQRYLRILKFRLEVIHPGHRWTGAVCTIVQNSQESVLLITGPNKRSHEQKWRILTKRKEVPVGIK